MSGSRAPRRGGASAATDAGSLAEVPPPEDDGAASALERCNHRLVKALVEQPEGRAALASMCGAIRDLVGCDRVQIWRGDVRQMTMSTVVTAGYSEVDAQRLAGLVVPMPLGLGREFLTSKVVFVPDASSQTEAIARLVFLPFGIDAIGLLLLERGRHPIGALQLSWCLQERARMPDRAILEAIRSHAAIALDFVARTEEALQLAETLSQTAIALGTIHDPNELLQTTAAKIAEAVGCDFATVHMVENDGTVLRRVAQYGLPEYARGEERIRVNAVYRDAPSPNPEADVYEVPDVSLAPGSTAHDPPPVASYFSVPLMEGSRAVCFLTVGYLQRTGRFSRRQISLVQGLSHHVLAALRNARAMQSLREVSEVKSDFIAAVSHDLRSPLHVLVGYSDMLLEGAVGDLNRGQTDLVERVRTAALRFRDLIEDVVDVARLESHHDALVLTPVSLRALCEGLRQELEGLARPEVELRFAVGDLHVLGDAAKIKTVLRNLLSNALKFAGTGFVEAEARLADPLTLVLRVRDTGPGIGVEDRARIFEMFQQGEAGRRAGGSGLGLGLYLVKRVATMLGGDVTLASADPGNTVFEVRLPIRSLPDPPDARQ